MGHTTKHGWPIHLACCVKTGGAAFRYCQDHRESMFTPPNTSPKELARSLRGHMTK